MKKKSAPQDVANDTNGKTKRATTKKTAAGEKKPNSGIGRYMVSAIALSSLVIIAASLLMGWLQFGRHQTISEDLLAKTIATQQASLVGQSIRQLEASVVSISANPALSDAFADPAGTTANALIAALPNSTMTLLPPGQVLLPESLSFTARELIQRARQAEFAVVSDIIPGNPPILYAARQSNDGGIVLIEQPLSDLHQTFSRLDIGDAYLVIRQPGNKPLFSIGKTVSQGQQASRSVAGLEVLVTIPRGAQDPALLNLFTLAAVGAVLLVMVIIASSFFSVTRALRKDAALLAHLAEDLSGHGQATPRGNFSFKPLELVTNSLRKLAENSRASGSPLARRPSSSKAKPDDEFMVSAADSAALLDNAESPGQQGFELPESIFREYDIRGIVGETLTAEYVELIGRAIGTEALQAGQQTVVVGRDGRLHSPELAEALMRGLTMSGRDVIDIGAVPTPVVYYATNVLDARSGISLTGSHNPANHNGLKIVIDGVTLTGERIRGLRERLARGELASGTGKIRQQDITDRYISEITRDIVLARPMKIAIDCGNGIAGPTVQKLFEQVGCEIMPLYMDVDGNFPNHHPDTSKPGNYTDLIALVKSSGADIGIAFDGDGDRLGVVTPAGEIIWPDRLMMLYARDLLSRTPGADIIFDVKCSRELARLISQHGGRPLMWRTGHSLIKAKLKETGAPLAGEMSGHIFFADRWYGFDDGAYAAARLLEILSLEVGSADEVFSTLRTGVTTPEINIPSTDSGKFALVEKLKADSDSFGGSPSTIDGLRVDFEDGWGLLRASNTSAVLVARFEGKDQAALTRISQLFKERLMAIDPSLKLPF